jgi:hypothetical protein
MELGPLAFLRLSVAINPNMPFSDMGNIAAGLSFFKEGTIDILKFEPILHAPTQAYL